MRQFGLKRGERNILRKAISSLKGIKEVIAIFIRTLTDGDGGRVRGVRVNFDRLQRRCFLDVSATISAMYHARAFDDVNLQLGTVLARTLSRYGDMTQNNDDER